MNEINDDALVDNFSSAHRACRASGIARVAGKDDETAAHEMKMVMLHRRMIWLAALIE